MQNSSFPCYKLIKELSMLLDLEKNLDKALTLCMTNLNQAMDSERSSIFIFQPWNHKLAIYSSYDIGKNEIMIPKSLGISGWVFVNRKPTMVTNAYADSRFFKGVDEKTGFHTRNLICAPLLDYRNQCLGTIQSLNKKQGDFSTDDLELLDLTARMVAVAIKNNRRYNEIVVTNEARKKLINKINDDIGNIFEIV